MSQVKYFLVFIITPAIPHGAFKMEVTFCVKAVYTPVLDKRVPVIAGPRQQPRSPGGSPVARPRKELKSAPPRSGEEAGFVPLRAQLVVRQHLARSRRVH